MKFSVTAPWDIRIGVLACILLAAGVEFVIAPQILQRENLRFWHGLASLAYLAHWLCLSMVCYSVFGKPVRDQV